MTNNEFEASSAEVQLATCMQAAAGCGFSWPQPNRENAAASDVLMASRVDHGLGIIGLYSPRDGNEATSLTRSIRSYI
jgi:hypothetical protein